jgi:hypothetical protein
VTLKCNYIISAFGSHLANESVRAALKPLKLEKWVSMFVICDLWVDPWATRMRSTFSKLALCEG